MKSEADFTSEATTDKVKVTFMKCKTHGKAIVRPGFGCSECLQSIGTEVRFMGKFKHGQQDFSNKDTQVGWVDNTSMMPNYKRIKTTMSEMLLTLLATGFLAGCIALFMWIVTKNL